MKILIFNANEGAAKYIVDGYINAFKSLNHEIIRWDGKLKSWKGFKPDLYIGCSGWKQEIPLDKTKKIIHVNPYGKYKIEAENNINENEEDIEWVLEQNPDVLFCYGMGQLINKYWGYWTEKLGLPVLGLPTAADSILYNSNNKSPKYDMSFVGGRWAYKSLSFQKWLDPIFKNFKNHIIYGWGEWKNLGLNYIGEIKQEEVCKLFNNTRICPAISEPHTHNYGIDVPERIFKVALCGCLSITDKINGIEEYELNETIPMAKTPKEMINLVSYYLSNEKERKELSLAQRELVLKKHTYISRAQKILEYI